MTYQECFYLGMGQKRKAREEVTLSGIVISFIGCGSIIVLMVMLVMAVVWLWEQIR